MSTVPQQVHPAAEAPPVVELPGGDDSECVDTIAVMAAPSKSRRVSVGDTNERPLRSFIKTAQTIETEALTDDASAPDGTRRWSTIAADASSFKNIKGKSWLWWKTLTVLNHKWTSNIMMTITIFSLVGDDLKIALTNRSTDEVFWGIFLFSLLTFFVEFIASIYVSASALPYAHSARLSSLQMATGPR